MYTANAAKGQPSAHPPGEAGDGSTQRTLGLVSAGVGVAAAGVGTFFVFRAVSLDEDSKQHCDLGHSSSCSKEGVAMREDALGAADVATVAFIAGAILVASGAVLWFTAPSRAKSKTTSLDARGLVLRF